MKATWPLVAPKVIFFLFVAKAAAAEPVARVEVTVLHAKKSPPFLHEKAKPYWDTLRRTFGDRFAFYDYLSSHVGELKKEERLDVAMPEGGTFTVVYQGASKDGKSALLLFQTEGLKTNVRLHDGGIVFQAGKRYKGGILIIGIKASFIR